MSANTSLSPTDQDWLNPDLWMDAKQLAAVLGISVGTVWNKSSAKSGGLPPVHRFLSEKGGIRFFKPQVAAWMRDRSHVQNVQADRARAQSATQTA